MIGEILGSYRIVQELGHGSMGEVYLAEHTILKRLAAVKLLLPIFSSDEVMVQRFFNEARALTAIQHPGIVQVYDFGSRDNGSAYLIMEHLEGEPLSDRLERLGRLSMTEALRIARHCARALTAAHATGIIHRDLKPDNVFLVRDGEVEGGERAKILDFGIAKLSDEKRFGLTQTYSGSVLGTPLYMAPEQCRNASEIDHRADIYSLGCVLYHMLCGHPPFMGDGIGDTIAGHMFETPPSIRGQVPDIPGEVEDLVLRALAKDPADRYANMTELATALTTVGPRSLSGRYMLATGQLEALDDDGAPSRESVSSLRYTDPGLSLDRASSRPPASQHEGSSTLGGAAAQSMADLRPRGRRLMAGLAVAGLAVVLSLVAMNAFDDGTPSGTTEEADQHAAAPGPDDPAGEDGKDGEAGEAGEDTADTPTAIEVRIESDPAGAAVYTPDRDDPVGTTPYLYEAPATSGEVSVRLMLDGYDAAEVSFPGNQNGVARVSMRQASAPATDDAVRRRNQRKKAAKKSATPDELMYR